MSPHYTKIDSIIAKIQKFKIEPEFTIALNERQHRTQQVTLTNHVLLKKFVELIAFSQQARSESVKVLLDQKVFDEIFENYDCEVVAQLNPCVLVDNHWNRITAIRMQTKLFQIVMFARLLRKNDKILSILRESNIKSTISSESDIALFWDDFKLLKKELKEAKAPFIRETTTLLHYLLEMGYDCIKPDSAVIKAAQNIGIAPNGKITDTHLMTIVERFQRYSLERRIRPSVLDLYLLIEGRQTGAEKLVHRNYYP